MSFVHLHVHTEFSALDGLGRVADTVAAMKAHGQQAGAITDHGTCAGWWAFAEACAASGVKPILGQEFYLALGSRHDPQVVRVPRDGSDTDVVDGTDTSATKAKTYDHLTVLAASRAGYRNLVAIHNKAQDTFSPTGSGYPRSKPLIDIDLLREHREGLIVLTGCIGGPVTGPLSRGDGDTARANLDALVGAVGRENVYLEVMEHGEGPEIRFADLLAAVRASTPEAAAHLVHARGRELLRFVDPDGVTLHDNDAVISRLLEGGLDLDVVTSRTGVAHLDVTDHARSPESATMPLVAALGTEYDLPLVATNDSHYAHEQDAHAHEALLAAQSGSTLATPTPPRFAFHGEGFHIRSGEQMRALRPEEWWARACQETVAVAERIEADVLPPRYLRLPRFPVPDRFQPADTGSQEPSAQRDAEMAYLRHLTAVGLRRRFGEELPAEVVERMDLELSTIETFGIAGYFLILWDLVRWARSQGILVGPGRGSSAGAMTAYVLGITGGPTTSSTALDPLRNGLLFERFINPTRKGMPDIDVDFEKNRIDEVRAYLAERYGRDRVARIGTYAMIESKQAIKRACRVLGHPVRLGETLTKAIPMDKVTPFRFSQLDETARAESAAFWTLVERHDARDVIDLARTFESVYAGAGIHACGIVVSDVDLHDLVPLRRDTRKGICDQAPLVTEWDAKGVGEDGIGLLKLDALGLRTLDIVAAAAANVTTLTGEVVDPFDLPDPDDTENERVARTWQMLSEGRTLGVFQLDSAGMTELTVNLAPHSLEHASALVALYRPGPLGAKSHIHYADRLNGREYAGYDIYTHREDEARQIDRALGVSHGLAIYQEQLMQLGDLVAGFDAGTRNRLQKAVSKKRKAEIDAVGLLFAAGAASRHPMQSVDASTGVITWDTTRTKQTFAPSTVSALWESFRDSGDYLFNKSHSAAYGYLAYITAYLKANWPSAYGAALLQFTDRGDKQKRPAALRALLEEGIGVEPPEVNTAVAATSPRDERTVVLGLSEVKAVGSAAHDIVAEREENGPFASIADLVTRVKVVDGGGDLRALNITALEALVEAGALDAFGPRRGLMRVARAVKMRPETLVPDEEWGVVERAVRQQSRCGLILGVHPMEALTGQLTGDYDRVQGLDERGRPTGGIGTVPFVELAQVPGSKRENLATCGLVTRWETRTMRSGGTRIEVSIEAPGTVVDGVVWDRTWQRISDAGIGVGSLVYVEAIVKRQEVEVTDEEGLQSTEHRTSLTWTSAHQVPFTDVGGWCRTQVADPTILAGLLFDPTAREVTPPAVPEPSPEDADDPAAQQQEAPPPPPVIELADYRARTGSTTTFVVPSYYLRSGLLRELPGLPAEVLKAGRQVAGMVIAGPVSVFRVEVGRSRQVVLVAHAIGHEEQAHALAGLVAGLDQWRPVGDGLSEAVLPAQALIA